MTASVGTPDSFQLNKVGVEHTWNFEEPWGDIRAYPVVKPTGVSATFSLGTVSVSAQIAAGWGQDGWGDENWGAIRINFRNNCS